MIRQSAILALLALLCAGEGQDDNEASILREIYLNKCRKIHENSQSMDVYLYESDYFCQYYCSGSDADGNYFFEDHKKDDGLKCTKNFGAKEASVCMNGACVLSSSMETCQNEMGGQVTAVEGKECKITCRGEENKEVEVQKPAESSCIMEDNPWRPASCTGSGYCRKDLNEIPVPEDSTSVNDDIAKAECQRRHGEDSFCYRGEENNACEYACLFNLTETMDWEFLTFQDGYSCGDGKECLRGDCHNTDEIEKCYDILGEPAEEIKVKECTKTCVGETKADTQSLAPDSDCIKLVDGWNPTKGTCNENAECVVDDNE